MLCSFPYQLTSSSYMKSCFSLALTDITKRERRRRRRDDDGNDGAKGKKPASLPITLLVLSFLTTIASSVGVCHLVFRLFAVDAWRRIVKIDVVFLFSRYEEILVFSDRSSKFIEWLSSTIHNSRVVSFDFSFFNNTLQYRFVFFFFLLDWMLFSLWCTLTRNPRHVVRIVV